jgi:dolichol-phosphate mannosyltransferase
MAGSAMRVSLITPTYNEVENLPLLAEEIFQVLGSCPDIDVELIVVDDASPDGTGKVADSLVSQYPMKVLHRSGKLGLGSAVMEGFAMSERPYLGVMDADLSHDPAILPGVIRGLAQYDIVIGSRFGATSVVEDWAWHRKLISMVGVGCARVLTGVEDPLSGYFFLRRPVLSGLDLTSTGYKILLEILVKGHYQSHHSVPFVFRNRQFSRSKLNSREHLLFAKQILLFSLRRLGGSRRPR